MSSLRGNSMMTEIKMLVSAASPENQSVGHSVEFPAETTIPKTAPRLM